MSQTDPDAPLEGDSPVEMSLDGTLMSAGPSSISGRIVVRPVLSGGEPHLKATPGRWRFTDLSWDADGVHLKISPDGATHRPDA